MKRKFLDGRRKNVFFTPDLADIYTPLKVQDKIKFCFVDFIQNYSSSHKKRLVSFLISPQKHKAIDVRLGFVNE